MLLCTTGVAEGLCVSEVFAICGDRRLPRPLPPVPASGGRHLPTSPHSTRTSCCFSTYPCCCYCSEYLSDCLLVCLCQVFANWLMTKVSFVLFYLTHMCEDKLFFSPFICLSVYLSVYLSIYLSLSCSVSISNLSPFWYHWLICDRYVVNKPYNNNNKSLF